MASIIRDKEGLKCPKCGRIEHVMEFYEVWACFEATPREDGGWDYRRREELDRFGERVEYECPICKETFYSIESVES